MRASISISLPEKLKQELDRVTIAEGVTRSDIVRESLKDYLFQRRFRDLRASAIAKAREKGIFTDEDVFDRVS